jgi:hypothetical protein
MMLDPPSLLDGLGGRHIVLEEIHRIQNQSERLKIAAGHDPRTYIVATFVVGYSGAQHQAGRCSVFFLHESKS